MFAFCPSDDRIRRGHKSKDARFFHILDTTYTKALVWAMGHRKTIIVSCILVMLSILPLFMIIGKNLMPRDDQSQLSISIRLPEGSSLAETTKYSEAYRAHCAHPGRCNAYAEHGRRKHRRVGQ